MSYNSFVASVVIPTYNRRNDLRMCLDAVKNQTLPVEIIVMDDDSTDGTSEMIKHEYPQVIYRHYTGRKGPSFLRNRGSEIAQAPILFPIDDDSVMASRTIVEQTLECFNDTRVGAVAIPLIKTRRGKQIHQAVPDSGHNVHVIGTYIGASHAVRRDLFIRLGGYREHLFYMGEERDYCIRMLAAGYFVKIGSSDPILHNESIARSSQRASYYGRRNDVLYVWHNVPALHIPIHLGGTLLNSLRIVALGTEHPIQMVRGTIAGLLEVWKYRHHRNPVDERTYRFSRRLKSGPILLSQLME